MYPFGGLILLPKYAQKDSSHNLLYKGVKEIITQKNLDSLYLVNPPKLQDIRSFIWNNMPAKIFYTYVFDLTRDIERTISRNATRYIRKARNLRIQVEESDDTKEYYRLFNLTYGRRNLRCPVSESFFKKVLGILRGNNCGKLWFACSPTDGSIAGEIIVWDTKRVDSWSAASDYIKSSNGATRLLQYEILRSLQEKGHKEIYLFCANIPNLALFMAELHPTLLPYYGIQHANMKYGLAEKTQHIVKDWSMGISQIIENGSKLFF